jgi:5-methylcytosine-specific restriction endonuclease McrA
MRYPCLECGAPSEGSRCAAHRIPDDRKRPGYGYAWTILSREMRRRYPFCQLCARSGVPLHVDHVTPRSLGGTDHPSNLRVLCVDCHRAYGRTKRSRG